MERKSDWKKVRVVVELPVRGELSSKDLRFAVEQCLDQAEVMKRLSRKPGSHRTGRLQIKEYGRVARVETQSGLRFASNASLSPIRDLLERLDKLGVTVDMDKVAQDGWSLEQELRDVKARLAAVERRTIDPLQSPD
jgi:hypothetical protein